MQVHVHVQVQVHGRVGYAHDMSAAWLERLSSSTTYAELQTLFESIAGEARTADDPRAIAAALNEAVVRIERERERDEEELHAFEDEYAAFQSDQRGVLGWLRRHVPFTATRRREKAHQETLADQRAEILGDVLVLARAAMLREQLLPAEERESGPDADAWRERLAGDQAPDGLRAYADTTAALGTQLERAEAFVQGIRTDIEAFEDADFAAEEDRRRQQQGIAAARSELAEIEARLRANDALRGEALQHLTTTLTEELQAEGGAYAHITQAVPRLEKARAEAHAVEDCLAELREGAAMLIELERRLVGLPEKQQGLADEAERLTAACRDARAKHARAEDALAEPTARYQEALADEAQARTAVREAQDELEAYFERTGQFDLEGIPSSESAPSPDERLKHAQQALERVHAETRRRRGPYQDLKVAAEEAREQADELAAQLLEAESALGTLGERAESLRANVERARGELRPTLDRLPERVTSYRRALDACERASALPAHADGLRPPQQFDLERADALWKGLVETVADEHQTLVHDIAKAQEERDALWRAHAEARLGAELAECVGATRRA